MITLPEDFKEFFNILNSNEVEYLLVGGYAVAFYGYIRATNDIDIWINIKPENVEKVIKSLICFGFLESQLDREVFKKKDQVIRMGVPPLRLELLTGISGVNFEECYKDRVLETIDGLEISILDIANLKKNKKASGRLKDLLDLENL
ncbi:MAG TPA: hypothetical protein PK771_16130 [Spirochaetota bacterium]|nr:hypothetical protein [Spirochaetota bacterium]